MEPKRVAIVSDFHCGHKYGLTPPQWKMFDFQTRLWKWYAKKAAEAKVDILIMNGDAIEGKGPKNGGVELITTDRIEQGNMAVEALSQFNAKKIYMAYGTPYHTGPDERFEDPIADALDAHIENRLRLNINGLLFDIRHHVSGSSTPYTHVTPLKKEQVMALLDQRIDRGDVVVRSHVHKFLAIQDNKGLALTTPCFQLHTEFGSRICNGDVDIGFIVFDIVDRQRWSWKREILDIKEFRAAPLKV